MLRLRRDSLDPCCQQGQHQIESECSDSHGIGRSGRWTEVRVDLHCRQENHETPKRIPTLGTREPGHARVEPGTKTKNNEFQRKTKCNMLPQSEPNLGRIVIERQIGRVHEKIKDPM